MPPVVVRNDEWTWRDVYNRVYKERAFDNIVISPGPGSPACPSDIGERTSILIQLDPLKERRASLPKKRKKRKEGLCSFYLSEVYCFAGICLRILCECGDIPILGVCLGHQVVSFSMFLLVNLFLDQSYEKGKVMDHVVVTWPEMALVFDHCRPWDLSMVLRLSTLLKLYMGDLGKALNTITR